MVLHLCSHQLDGEREPVKPVAKLDYGPGCLGRDGVGAPYRPRAFEKQRSRGRGARVCRSPGAVGKTQGPDVDLLLAAYAERRPAGDQNLEPGAR